MNKNSKSKRMFSLLVLFCALNVQVQAQYSEDTANGLQNNIQTDDSRSVPGKMQFYVAQDTTWFEKFKFVKCFATDTALSELNSPSTVKRENASHRLIEIADRGAIIDLMKQLQNQNGYDLVSIYEAISRVTIDGDDELIDFFLEGIKRPSWKIAAASVIALGKIGDKNQIPAVTKIIKHPYFQARQYALLALERLAGADAISAIAACINDPDVNVRQTAAYLLGIMKSEKAIDPLSEMINDEKKEVRQMVVYALGLIGSEQAINTLGIALRSMEPIVRAEAASAFGKIPCEAIVPFLKEALMTERDDEIKCLLLKSIGGVKSSKDAFSILQMFLKKGNTKVKISCIESLATMRVDSLGALLEEVSNSHNSKIRSAVARALRESREQQSVQILYKLAQNSDIEVRIEAISSLASIRNDNSNKILDRLFSDTLNVKVFKATAEALDKIGAKTTVSAMLLNVLQNSKDQAKAEFSAGFLSNYPDTKNEILQLVDSGKLEEKVLAKLITTLSYFGDRTIAQYLIELDNDKKFKVDVRKSIILALGELGDPVSISYLLNCLSDEDKEIWITAAKSLIMIPKMDFSTQLTLRKDDLLEKIQVPKHKFKNLITGLATVAEVIISFYLPGDLYVPDGTLVSSFLPSIDSEKIPSRAIAAEIAGRLRLNEAINPLRNLLFDDEDTEVIKMATQALARFDNNSAAKIIVSYLEEPNFYKNLIAASSSSEHRLVIERMKHRRSLAAYYMDGTPTETGYIYPFLANILKRYFVIQSLVECKENKLAGTLLLNLYSPESGLIRQACANALGNIGDNRAIRPLLIRLQDRKSNVRYAAAIALRKLGVNNTEPDLLRVKDELIHKFNSSDTHERLAALINLAELHFDDSGNFFLQVLENSSDVNFRLQAFLGLSQLKDSIAVEVIRQHKLEILEYLHDQNRDVRLQAVRVIGYSEIEDRDEVLQKIYVEDGSFLIRETALKTKKMLLMPKN